jgi:putative ABC transport system permease protein
MSWLQRLVNTMQTGRMRRDIDRELAFHLAERVEQLRAAGLSAADAERQARLQFGNPAVQIERTRDVDISSAVDAFFRNVRHAGRALRRTPGFTATVVLTLALGIGGNTAVFTAVDAVLLRPLAFPDADRLVQIVQVVDGVGETGIAPIRLEDWNRLNTTFEGLTGHSPADAIDTRGPVPERLRRAIVAPRFLEVLGVLPASGRDFDAAEYLLQGPQAMLLSERAWRARGADPRVLDAPITIQGLTIWTVGIMPAAFRFPDAEIDIWSPNDVDAPWVQSRALTWYTGVGRLKSGVTLEQARDDLERIQARLAEQHPATDRGIGIRMEPLKDVTIGDAARSLWLVFGAVSVLLLIACTNIAALLLCRAARREREIAVRYSLGGSRGSIVAQLLTEAALLAVTGAAAGLLLTAVSLPALRSFAADIPRVEEIVLDGRILLYTAALTTTIVLACGLIPAWRGMRGASPVIGGSERTVVPTRHTLQWLLVGVQVSLSVALLAGAALLLRTVDALSRVELGFEPARVLTLHISGAYGFETTDARVVRLNRVIDELTALPDVDAAAITSALPGVRAGQQQEFVLAERRNAPALTAESRVVSPAYFATMRIPLVGGTLCRRPPDAGGRGGVETEVMVNRAFADRYLAGTAVMGMHLSGGIDYLAQNGHIGPTRPSRIAGIVGNAREIGADRVPSPTVYTCFSAPSPAPAFVIRTTGEPADAVNAGRRRIADLEPLRAVYDIAPLQERIDAAYAQNRARTWILTLFAATALALVCAGVYGTLSYAISLRRREVALHLALGALRRTVIQRLVGASVRTTAAAAASGLLLALIFTQTLSAMLYGVSPFDPPTLAAVVAFVVGVAFAAALVPAARATFVQPMRALREE